jgi:hypothetical protein
MIIKRHLNYNKVIYEKIYALFYLGNGLVLLKSDDEQNDYRFCDECKFQTIYPWDLELDVVDHFLCDSCVLKSQHKVSIDR